MPHRAQQQGTTASVAVHVGGHLGHRERDLRDPGRRQPQLNGEDLRTTPRGTNRGGR